MRELLGGTKENSVSPRGVIVRQINDFFAKRKPKELSRPGRVGGKSTPGHMARTHTSPHRPPGLPQLGERP